MIISPWLGGEPTNTALSFDGHTLSYGELCALVESHELTEAPVVRAEHSDPVQLLVRVLAALRHARPVLVSAPEQTAPLPQQLPLGTDLVLLTSGSSGRSRAVARTARSWYDSFAPLTVAADIRPNDVVALTGPLHVSMHLFAALHTLSLGAELSDNLQRATVVHCTPTVLTRILSAKRMPQRIVVAGAALPAASRLAAESRGATVTEYYGAAELSFVAISGPDGQLRAFDGVELHVRDGVLWARSPYISLGYANIAEHSPGALLRDDEGFASVGDIAELSTDGVLRVRGRGDSGVTTAGTTVLSEDIERALEELAGVRAAAVLAEPHPVLGEIIVAVLECDAELEKVRTQAHQSFAPAERPRRWLRVKHLPRTASGKLAKGELRAGISAGTLPYSELGVHSDVS